EISAKYFLAALLLPPFIALSVYALLGCLPFIFNTVRIILSSPQANSYAISFGSGPWYRYLIDYMLLSPWIVILATGFIFCFFLNQENNELVVYFAVIFVSSFILFDFFTKNLRYVMILDMPLRLFSLLMLNTIANKFLGRSAVSMVLILTITLAFFDCLNFYHLFIRGSIYDPVSFFLFKAQHLIPFK
ncbi:MAG: hypothetical protein PHY88_03315, partial [Candidatus Omnitrophica bacterium]|nr:hypothetical protein [Candidatus Omnitrophota bacterium]